MYSKAEKKALIVKFWAGFDEYCSGVAYLPATKKRWLLHRTDISQVALKFDAGRKSVAVILEVGHRNERRRLMVYELLEKYKLLLEQGFEDGLIWDFAYERENGEEVCRIYLEQEGLDMHRQKQWDDIYAFFAKNMHQLQQNFLDIRDLLKEEILAANRL